MELLRCGTTIDLRRSWSLNHLDFHAGWRFWSIKIRIYHEISLVVWHLNHFVGCLAFEYFCWLFGIWTCLALSLQEWCWRILHYWKCVGNHCPLVGGRVCTAQTFFSCSPGILNIRTVGTAGMHNFDQSFKSSGISSPSDFGPISWSPFIDFVCNFCVGGIRALNPDHCKVLARSGVRGRADVRACVRAWPCLRDSM